MEEHTNPSIQGRENNMKGNIKLGVLRLDYDFSPTPGDMAHPQSFGYQVIYRVVPGFSFEMCKSGELTPDVLHEFIEAIDWLQQREVSGISGSCGFLMYFQRLARAHSRVPVFMSPLVQLPALINTLPKNAKICILSSNLNTLKAMENIILGTMGSDAGAEKMLMVGCENIAGFEAVEKQKSVITDVEEAALVNLVMKILRENEEISSFLFECTQLTPFSNAVREASGVPVYDSITCCNFFIAGFHEHQGFGKTGWKQKWSGQREQYQFGQELDQRRKNKLISID